MQLKSNKYVLLDKDLKRLDKLGNEIPKTTDDKKAKLSLGDITLFIKKQKLATYLTYIEFDIPQLKNIISKNDILSKNSKSENDKK